MATITTSPAVTPFADLLDLSEKVAIVTGGAKGNPPTPVSENKPRGDGVRWQPVHWCRLSAKTRHPRPTHSGRRHERGKDGRDSAFRRFGVWHRGEPPLTEASEVLAPPGNAVHPRGREPRREHPQKTDLLTKGQRTATAIKQRASDHRGHLTGYVLSLPPLPLVMSWKCAV